MSHVHAAAREIATSLSKFTVVVTKSTVPVGTSDEVETIMMEENPDAEFAAYQIRSSCARARPSATSGIPTES
jgi:UDP-glucose 6-dehydrogenase